MQTEQVGAKEGAHGRVHAGARARGVHAACWLGRGQGLPGWLPKCGTGCGHIQNRQQSSPCWWSRMAWCGGQGRAAGGAGDTGGHTASHVTLPYSQKHRWSQPVTLVGISLKLGKRWSA